MNQIKTKKLRDGAILPKRADEGAAGYDVTIPHGLTRDDIKTFGDCGLATDHNRETKGVEGIYIEPGERILIPLGFAVEIPQGYELQLRPRSGLSLKKGITLVNCVGTVDSSFRGEMCVALVNVGSECQTIEAGERVAQLVMAKHESPEYIFVDELSETERGEGGFGSTGMR